MNLHIFKILLFVATSIVLLSTVYAQISGKTNSGPNKTEAVSSSTTNELKPQTTCPVMGGAINRDLFVDYNGKRIYVCCADCIKKVSDDPEKYIKKLEGMGESIETIDNDVKKTDTASNSRMRMHNMNMNMKKTDTTGTRPLVANEASYWTCTTHPEVHKTESGICPICGRKLVNRKNGKDTTNLKSADNSIVPAIK